MEKLSTQKIFNDSGIDEAAKYTRECSVIQNTGAILKHGYRRRFGKLLGDIEEKEGEKGRKKVLAELQVPFKEAKKAVNEAAVPEDDYQRYIDGVAKKSKEITDAGTIRAGKKNTPPKRISVAARIVQKLGPWVDSILVGSLGEGGECLGSQEEIIEAKIVLEKLSKQFMACVNAIKID